MANDLHQFEQAEQEFEREVVSEGSRFKRHFLRRVFDLSVAAFGLVAALAWNEAITALVKQYIPSGSGTIYLFIYAILITLLAVVVTLQIGSIAAKLNLDEDKKENAPKRRR